MANYRDYGHSERRGNFDRNRRRGDAERHGSLERGGLDKKLKGKRPKMKLAVRNRSRYKIPKGEKIDYKNLNLLQKYLTDRGKILSRRVTGISADEQRNLTEAIKRARFLALLPSGSASRK